MLSSNSVSLVASFVDALLDFVSTLIILVSNFAMGRKGDQHKYPAGKKRFEPLGVLVFSVTMIASFFQVRFPFDQFKRLSMNLRTDGHEIGRSLSNHVRELSTPIKAERKSQRSAG